MHRLRFSIIVSCFCLFVGNVVADDLVLKQYAEKVQPVVKQLCNKCHQGEKAKGDFRIDTLNPDMIGGEDQEAWHDALNRFNTMDIEFFGSRIACQTIYRWPCCDSAIDA